MFSRLSKQSGQTLVEVALVLPILIFFILGSLNLAYYVSARQVLVHATQSGTLAVSASGNLKFGAMVLYREAKGLADFDEGKVEVSIGGENVIIPPYSKNVSKGMFPTVVPRGATVGFEVKYEIPKTLHFLPGLGEVYVKSESLVVCRVANVNTPTSCKF